MNLRPRTVGGKGVKCYKIMEKTGNVVGFKAVNEDDEVMIINTEGIISPYEVRTAFPCLAGSLPAWKLINLPEGDKVASIAKVRKGDEEEEETSEDQVQEEESPEE